MKGPVVTGMNRGEYHSEQLRMYSAQLVPSFMKPRFAGISVRLDHLPS